MSKIPWKSPFFCHLYRGFFRCVPLGWGRRSRCCMIWSCLISFVPPTCLDWKVGNCWIIGCVHLHGCWVCMMMGLEILGTAPKHPVQAEKFLAAPHSNWTRVPNSCSCFTCKLLDNVTKQPLLCNQPFIVSQLMPNSLSLSLPPWFFKGAEVSDFRSCRS